MLCPYFANELAKISSEELRSPGIPDKLNKLIGKSKRSDVLVFRTVSNCQSQDPRVWLMTCLRHFEEISVRAQGLGLFSAFCGATFSSASGNPIPQRVLLQFTLYMEQYVCDSCLVKYCNDISSVVPESRESVCELPAIW
jgi:hypothetical protein